MAVNTKVSRLRAAAAVVLLLEAVAGTGASAGAQEPGSTPTPDELVAILAELRVGITREEAAALLAMSGPQLVRFLDDQGLAVPARLRRLRDGESPAEVLTRADLAQIVAPLASPPGEPQVSGIASDVARRGHLLQSIESEFQGRTGLVRLDDAGDVVVPVRDVNLEDGRIAEALGVEFNTNVVVENLHGLTYDEMESLRAEVQEVLAESDLDNWGVGLLGQTQSVYVSLPERVDPALRSRVDDLAAAAAARVSGLRQTRSPVLASDVLVVAAGENELSEARDNSPQGGGKWISVEGAGGCTLGYVVLTANAAPRGMSAGHCAGPDVVGVEINDRNLDRSSDGEFYGNVLINTYGNNEPDVMTWPIANWDDHTRVYLGDGWKVIQGVTAEPQQNIGLQVCGTGWGIQHDHGVNQKCDSLDILNYAFTDNGITTPDTNCFERDTQNGDSGGPTYALDSESRALATGITHGDHTTSFAGVTSHYWCYVTITDALGVANYVLPTGK